MSKKTLLFYLVLIAITALVAFFIHLAILKLLGYALFSNKIVLAYVLNALSASVILGVLYFFRKRFKDQLGFLFMAGSFLKFALFFIVFYPTYKLDGAITAIEFTAFFVPYVTCLITETLGGIKLVNSLDA